MTNTHVVDRQIARTLAELRRIEPLVQREYCGNAQGRCELLGERLALQRHLENLRAHREAVLRG